MEHPVVRKHLRDEVQTMVWWYEVQQEFDSSAALVGEISKLLTNAKNLAPEIATADLDDLTLWFWQQVRDLGVIREDGATNVFGDNSPQAEPEFSHRFPLSDGMLLEQSNARKHALEQELAHEKARYEQLRA